MRRTCLCATSLCKPRAMSQANHSSHCRNGLIKCKSDLQAVGLEQLISCSNVELQHRAACCAYYQSCMDQVNC